MCLDCQRVRLSAWRWIRNMGNLASACFQDEDKRRPGEEEEEEHVTFMQQQQAQLQLRSQQRLKQEQRQQLLHRTNSSSGSSSSTITITSGDLKSRRVQPILAEAKREDEGMISLLSVGVIGTGRSSFINTLLNSKDACKVSGGQLRGTRGYNLEVGKQSEPLVGVPVLTMNFMDTEGIRSDQMMRVDELSDYLVALSGPVKGFPSGTISHIVFTLDVEERQNGPSVLNLLLLDEVFRSVRGNCFLCLTKWNSNSVQAEWNKKLYQWFRAHRRAPSLEEIKENPPTPEEMWEDYVNYVETKLNTPTEQFALQKMRQLLAFFENRVIFALNLDNMQQEDRMEGELPAHEEYLYRFYRNEAINKMFHAGAVPVKAISLPFVQDSSAISTFAAHCVQTISAGISGTSPPPVGLTVQ